MRFTVIEDNISEYFHLVKSCSKYDFYHSPFYQNLTTKDLERSILLICSSNEGTIYLPLICRQIGDTGYKDLTSAYGYVGPVATKDISDLTAEFFEFFREEFNLFCSERRIISVFSRLHPLIPQKLLFCGLGIVENINKTVVIDLKMSNEEIWRNYRKSLKPEINRLRRENYLVEEAKSEEEIRAFISIYHQTMDRVNADESYYFPVEYFINFLNNPDFESLLLLSKKDGKVIAGAIFTCVSGIMQYHLAGTDDDFISVAPMKLIIDEARLIGKIKGLEYLHLGGGVGGSDTDSLFRFKSAFSKETREFCVWKYIVNEEVYRRLSKDIPNTAYFPRYRAPTKYH